MAGRRDLHTVKSGGARADVRKYFQVSDTKKIAVCEVLWSTVVMVS